MRAVKGKVEFDAWYTPLAIRTLYRVAYSQLLSMRLLRYPGELVARRGKRKILFMKMTPDLDAYLRKF